MKNWKRKLLCGLVASICLGAVVYATRDFWREQIRIYIWGSIEVAADKYGCDLPRDIDTVEVFTLSQDLDAGNTNGFYGYDPEPLATVGHVTLTGTNATEVIELWSSLITARNFQAMCFEPAYGLQFKRKGKIYFQTSVCWDCSGYTLPISLLGMKHLVGNGFDAKGKAGQKLLHVLENHLPLPPEPAKPKSP